MRSHHPIARLILVAAAALSITLSAYGQGKTPTRPGRNGKPSNAEDQAAEKGEGSVPLTLDDIAKLRRQRVMQDKIVEKAAEQGVDFEVTPAERNKLRGMGFKPAQIDAMKDAYRPPAEPGKPDAGDKPGLPGPLVPGKGLRTTDARRDQVQQNIAKINKASRADLQAAPAQHVTLWAAKDVQAAFLPEIKKLEDFFRTKCKEPIRSGLDKRSAHVILIARRYEFEKWVDAMFDLIGDQFKEPNNPGGNTDLKASVIKGGGLFTDNFVVFCLENRQMEPTHRSVAAGVGYMYLTQLAEQRPSGPLTTGFANGAECILFGTPSVMIFSSAYGMGERNLGADPKAWLHLVQQRIAANQVSALNQLLKMDTTTMVMAHYAEAWTLVSLLAAQPEKFAALVLKLREEKSALQAIQDVYGWDEPKLTAEWHKYVLGQR